MKVKVQHPHLPDGYRIVLTGLNAVLLNNEDVEVDDEAITQYEAATGRIFADTVKEKLFGGPGVKKEAPVTTVVEDKEPTTSLFGGVDDE